MKSSSLLFGCLALSIGGGLLLSGCAFMHDGPRNTDRSSSVVNYLYPKEANPLPPTAIPVLRLPLRVGVAFVPSGTTDRPVYGSSGISEMQKALLLERVAKEFRSRDYIQSIEIIPTTYLRAAGGFANLDQVGNMMGVDVIALLAYDQVQFTNENLLSLSYWTIVGAYIFNGNKNDTQTLMEAAVYDIRSRHLLFRAPGTSQIQGSSTAVNVSDKLRHDASGGFDAATDVLIKNLQVQLELFRERVKQSPESVRIEHKPGYTGGGDIGKWFAAILALLAMARWVRSRQSQAVH